MKKTMVLALSALACGVALADGPGKSETGLDYNKLELDYMSAKVSSKTYTGSYTSGSFLISDNIYVLGNYANLTRSGSSIEKSNLGLGFRLGVAANADAFSSIAYASQTAGSTKTGYNLALGLKGNVVTNTELSGAYGYSTAGSSSYNTLGLNLKYNISELFFVTGGYQNTTGSTSSSGYTLGVGLKF